MPNNKNQALNIAISTRFLALLIGVDFALCALDRILVVPAAYTIDSLLVSCSMFDVPLFISIADKPYLPIAEFFQKIVDENFVTHLDSYHVDVPYRTNSRVFLLPSELPGQLGA